MLINFVQPPLQFHHSYLFFKLECIGNVSNSELTFSVLLWFRLNASFSTELLSFRDMVEVSLLNCSDVLTQQQVGHKEIFIKMFYSWNLKSTIVMRYGKVFSKAHVQLSIQE